MRILTTVSIIAGIAGARSTPATAQAIPFSQHGEVRQMVGLTEISVIYNRPVARGRTLFGPEGVVKWGKVWHPGADSATRIVVSSDVIFEGQPLPKGEYSLWLIPEAAAPWTVIVSRAAHVFHQPYPGEADDVLRAKVSTETSSHMETMAYYFPVVARDSTLLRLHWGSVVLPIRIRIP